MIRLLHRDPITGYSPAECIINAALLALMVLAMCLAYGSIGQ